MKGKSFSIWQRIYYRLFKGIKIVDIGGLFTKRITEQKGMFVVGSPGAGRMIRPGDLGNDNLVLKQFILSTETDLMHAIERYKHFVAPAPPDGLVLTVENFLRFLCFDNVNRTLLGAHLTAIFHIQNGLLQPITRLILERARTLLNQEFKVKIFEYEGRPSFTLPGLDQIQPTVRKSDNMLGILKKLKVSIND